MNTLSDVINKHRHARAQFLNADDGESDALFPAESEAHAAVLYFPCRTLDDLHEKLAYLREELPTGWFAPTLGEEDQLDRFLASIASVRATA